VAVDHVLQGRHVLAVAGTHGKTTTTSMLAWILDRAGLTPGFLVGGVPLNFGVSARLGSGKTFVIEADEYDTAFFDKRSKFVHYRPRTAILNNLEFDHADIFETSRRSSGSSTTSCAPCRAGPDGRQCPRRQPAACAGDGLLERGAALRRAQGRARALRARGEPHAFDVLRGSLKIARVEWALLGEHNQLNALAAIAAAEHVGVSPEVAAKRALASFENVRRRLELRGEVNGIKVYDDFAHHPTAMRTTVNGCAARWAASASWPSSSRAPTP
jgi:UDP-N-acetylmuramate: L-alanyl-gamma-D-glutamyl-meso-diaminopimelate ligase